MLLVLPKTKGHEHMGDMPHTGQVVDTVNQFEAHGSRSISTELAWIHLLLDRLTNSQIQLGDRIECEKEESNRRWEAMFIEFRHAMKPTSEPVREIGKTPATQEAISIIDLISVINKISERCAELLKTNGCWPFKNRIT
ncbi:hypothetical protein M5689_019007 [Euphorbia peplus]|nr:hypothetical protein M5689_019007 [Euphorbia peplus]